MAGLGWVARKVGLGLRPEDDASIAPQDWIEDQLTKTFPRLAPVAVESGAAKIVEWPAELTFDLATCIERATTMRRIKDEIATQNLDPDAFDKAMFDRELKYAVRFADQNRFANTAIYGGDQIKQRLAHFWLNHFTVGAKETTPELIGNFWDAIYASLDGSFEELVYRVTSHPAMLIYLDNIYNIGENSRKAHECRGADCVVGLNDNLARELMELHTVSPARGYSEDDIHNGAKILAGWGDIFELPWDDPPKDWSQPWQPYHAEPGQKTVLGRTVEEGPKGLRVLTDMLAADASTRSFVSGKLARHFIGEDVTAEDTAAIEAAWESSNGHLPTIHRAVLARAIASPAKRFHWPLTWMFEVLRMSGATLVRGYSEINSPLMGVGRNADELMDEMGNSFWSERQPNGFSDRRADWISTEHMDRRIRFANVVFNYAKPRLSPDEIIERNGFGEATRQLVAETRVPEEKFMLLACSPEMMET